MKTTSLSILGIFLNVVLLFASNDTADKGGTSISSIVTASDYCCFLNDAAVTDTNHLYDTAISTDPEAACIIRLGNPGSFSYEVIAGRENFPITYVSELSKQAYLSATELEETADDNQSTNAFLCSNQSFFNVTRADTAALSLAPFVNLTPSISSWNTGDTLLAAGVAIGVGILGTRYSSEVALKPYETDEFKNYNQQARKNYVDAVRSSKAPQPSAPPASFLEDVRTSYSVGYQMKNNGLLEAPHTAPIVAEAVLVDEPMINGFDLKYIDSRFETVPSKERTDARHARTDKLTALKLSLSAQNSKLNQALRLPLRSEARTILTETRATIQKCLDPHQSPSLLSQLQQDTRQFLLHDLFQEMEKLLPETEASRENNTGHANFVAQKVALLHQVLKEHLNYEEKVVAQTHESERRGRFTQDLLDDNMADQLFAPPIVTRSDVGRQFEYFRNRYNYAKVELSRIATFAEDQNSWNNDAHDCLAFASLADHQFLDEQKWNILYERAKNRPSTRMTLNHRLQNYVYRLECSQRLQELRKLADGFTAPANKDELISAYEAWQRDLTANPTRGLTIQQYLRYAGEQQGWFCFRDEYGIAPYLTPSMATAIHLVKIPLYTAAVATAAVVTLAIIDYAIQSQN